jgi:cell division septum initiation protein DivIVA
VNTDKEAEDINKNIENKDARVISLETKRANELS